METASPPVSWVEMSGGYLEEGGSYCEGATFWNETWGAGNTSSHRYTRHRSKPFPVVSTQQIPLFLPVSLTLVIVD